MVVAIDPKQLDAVDAHLFERAHPGHRLGGIAWAAEHGINEDPRRRDFAFRTLLAEFQRAPGVAADVADGGDAAREPDVEFISNGLGFAAALLLQVGVGVDQAGEHVSAGGIDDGIGIRGRGRTAAGEGHGVERDHVGDRIVFDHDVFRAAGRRSVAIDHDALWMRRRRTRLPLVGAVWAYTVAARRIAVGSKRRGMG